MSPAVKRAVELDAVLAVLLLRDVLPPVVGRQDPIQVRRREAERSVVPQDAAALGQEREPVLEREVLQEVLGVDRGDLAERQALTDVENLVDARESLVVDVDPARDRLLAAPDVQAGGPRGVPRRGGGLLPKESHRVRVFTTLRELRQLEPGKTREVRVLGFFHKDRRFHETVPSRDSHRASRAPRGLDLRAGPDHRRHRRPRHGRAGRRPSRSRRRGAGPVVSGRSHVRLRRERHLPAGSAAAGRLQGDGHAPGIRHVRGDRHRVPRQDVHGGHPAAPGRSGAARGHRRGPGRGHDLDRRWDPTSTLARSGASRPAATTHRSSWSLPA